jgi:6-pyruvoyltetrahydropterin/6-carboxytetrahydropterin synthase
MFTVGTGRSFHIYHFLEGDFGDESKPHTHDYKLQWRLETNDLDENGFSFDLARMKEILDESLAGIEGVLLNDLPYFARKQPSLENFGLFLLEILHDSLEQKDKKRIVSSKLKVWEDPETWSSIQMDF